MARSRWACEGFAVNTLENTLQQTTYLIPRQLANALLPLVVLPPHGLVALGCLRQHAVISLVFVHQLLVRFMRGPALRQPLCARVLILLGFVVED